MMLALKNRRMSKFLRFQVSGNSEILPSCSRTLPGITGDDKDAYGDDDAMKGLSGSRRLFRFLRFYMAAYTPELFLALRT